MDNDQFRDINVILKMKSATSPNSHTDVTLRDQVATINAHRN